jgi:uncharacterized secreted protein with C-terminal beta-propeller domain
MKQILLLSIIFNLFFTIQSNALESVKNCSTLVSDLKQAAIKKMEQRLDRNLEMVLNRDWCYPVVYSGGILDNTAPEKSTSGDEATSGATEYSETNVQVSGVDEADFVKNDGTYIYILAHGKFRIVKAWKPETAAEVSSFKIEGIPKKMYVHNKRAFIYSSLEQIVSTPPDIYLAKATYTQKECTYGYDCEFTGDGRELKITVLDISNVEQPTLVREINFSGAYLNSRRIDNAIYSVVVFPEPIIDGLKYFPEEVYQSQFCDEKPQPVAEMTEIFNQLKAKNKALIESAEIEKFLPTVKDSLNNQTPFEQCDNFYIGTEGDSFVSILSADINSNSPLNATTIFGKSGAVYASNSALYIASRFDQTTRINKFALPTIKYSGSGTVKGRVLNQFSMDEFKNFFRIATTTGYLPDPKTHSTISILEQQDDELVNVGKIDNIAPTEDIRSARFIGDKGYIVTFKKTDPLFVLDLSNSKQPKIAGELKIPGYSTYMHPLDDKHLLTIGYDAIDQGKFAFFQGIMLQIFDIENMNKPSLVHKEIIGSRGSSSEAATNHLAFNYFGSKKLLALPMNICEKSERAENDGSFGDLMTFAGLLVYKIDTENGFELVRTVPHVAPETDNKYQGYCYNWWTQSNTYVKRSIFMDDYVFSITEDTIKANKLSSLEKDIAIIHLSDQLKCDNLNLDQCQTEKDCLSNNGIWQNETCQLPSYKLTRTSNPYLCTANYNEEQLNIPCVQINNTQYQAILSNKIKPIEFKLKENEQATINLTARGCEVYYTANTKEINIPCIKTNLDNQLYWAKFKVLDTSPFIMELIDVGKKND